jgi:hypothetical protein
MILGLIYAVAHLFAGPLAAYWTWRRLKRAGFNDGCFLFLAAAFAFILWPIALPLLVIEWAAEKFVGE